MTLFIDGFQSIDDIRREFKPDSYSWRNGDKGDCDLTDADEVLVAAYVRESYEGSAFVLFRREGSLFEVHGGHCSCYGLEGQWSPEETTLEALKARVDNGGKIEWYTDPSYRDEGASAERAIRAHLFDGGARGQ